MVSAPTTLRPTATVAEARRFFEDDHVHMALIARSGVLLGTVVRGDLLVPGDDEMPALSRSRLIGVGTRPRRVGRGRSGAADPARPATVAVVDDSGALAGLLCLKRRLTGFCGDADVAARAGERGTICGPSTPRGG